MKTEIDGMKGQLSDSAQEEEEVHPKGFWRWCVTLIIIKILDFVQRPDFYKPENTTFRKLDLFPSSGVGGGTYSTEKPKACLSTGDARTKEGQPLETRGL
jgi:hypothetical protein